MKYLKCGLCFFFLLHLYACELSNPFKNQENLISEEKEIVEVVPEEPLDTIVETTPVIMDSLPKNLTVRLKCESLGMDTMGIPHSEVILKVNDQLFKIVAVNACETFSKSKYKDYDIPEDALSACGGWWAGMGDYFYVTREGESLKLMHGWVEEMDTSGGYHYKEIKTLGVNEIKPSEELRSTSKRLPKEVRKMIPDNYSLMDTTYGDLNKDPFLDMVLILKRKKEAALSKGGSQEILRPLWVLLGQEDGSYRKVYENKKVVYCANCGGMMGDPYMQTVIKDGYFTVEHYGGSAWRWSRYITFKYDKASHNWFLHKDGGVSFNINDPDKTTEEIKTIKDFGKVSFEDFNAYDNESMSRKTDESKKQ